MLEVSPLKLREWKAKDFESFKRAEQIFKKLSETAGKNNNRYKEARERLKRHVIKDLNVRVYSIIKTPVDIRAYLSLLEDDNEFYENVVFDHNDLDAFMSIRSPMSRLSLTQLIRVFFTDFEALVSGDLIELDKLSKFIQFQLDRVNAHLAGKSNPLSIFHKNKELLFDVKGPSNVVAEAKNQQIDLDQLFIKLSMSSYINARYHERCRFEYYLNTLETMSVGEDHYILKELSKPGVCQAFLDEKRMIGHKAIEIMISRTDGEISEAWRSVILSIAGDPRVPKSSASYRKWWAFIDESYIGRVIGWLSQLDLQIFLDILEDSARVNGNLEMQRMFPARKAFLEGLLDQKLLVSSRLFLGREAASYLKSGYLKDELPTFANYSSRQTSVIYLRLVNGLHFVEGSHSFKLKIVDKLPSRSNIDNWNVTQFGDNELRTSLVSMYLAENKSTNYIDVTHANLHWQNKAIEYLENNGLQLDKSQLFIDSDYRNYRYRYGI